MELAPSGSSEAACFVLGIIHYRLLAGMLSSIFCTSLPTCLLQSLATGRLATFSLPFVDCELPYDPDQMISDDGTVQPSCKSSNRLTLFKLFAD
jgi:hypothetical protein